MTAWLDTGGFTPHGFCLSWDPSLMAAFILSNAMIAAAYLTLSIVLTFAALQPRPAVPRWLYWSFALFILCCGVTHVLDNVTLWLPVYRLQAVVLAITALISLFAAALPVSLWVRREADRWRR
jgi:hypothetical protein